MVELGYTLKAIPAIPQYNKPECWECRSYGRANQNAGNAEAMVELTRMLGMQKLWWSLPECWEFRSIFLSFINFGL